MHDEDPVAASLYLVEDDLAQPIYRRFEALAPASAALMSHMDDHMIGRMMTDALTLLMSAPEDVDQSYLRFEMDSHRNYGVTPEMFPPLLAAVRDTVRAYLGDRWQAAMEAAWQQRIEAHLRQIERVTVAG